LDDEKNLPYTQATILELMRCRTIACLALPHYTLKDTTVGGYYIPANTTVIVNLYGAHMDPEVFPEPEVFRPERFLDENGKVTGRERNVSFSFGKRACIGQELARQEVFLFCSTLVHQFKMLPPEGQEKIIAHERVFLTNSPSPFKVRLMPRLGNN